MAEANPYAPPRAPVVLGLGLAAWATKLPRRAAQPTVLLETPNQVE